MDGAHSSPVLPLTMAHQEKSPRRHPCDGVYSVRSTLFQESALTPRAAVRRSD